MNSRALMAAGLLLASAPACGGPLEPAVVAPFGLVLSYHFPELGDDPLTWFDFESDGTLWALTARGRVVRADGSSVDYRAFPAGSGVRDLFIDGSDRVWAAVGDAFGVYEDGAWTVRPAPDVLAAGTAVDQVAVDDAGDVLLAAGTATAGGLLLQRGGGWSLLTPQSSGLPGRTASAVEVGGDGSFWVGSTSSIQGRGGVVRIADGAVQAVYDTQAGLLHPGVAALDAAGERVYVGIAGAIFDSGDPRGGLQVLSTGDGSVTTHFPSATGLTSDQVLSVAHGAGGEVWFTTRRHGSPACGRCPAGVGRMDAEGRFEVLSSASSDLAPDEHLPWIRVDPEGHAHVLAADRHAIFRIVR